MMLELYVETPKLHLMVLREWHRKSDPAKAVKNINASTGKEIISEKDVKNWYERFESPKFAFVPPDSQVSYAQHGNLHNSLVFTNYSNNCRNFYINNGRFLFVYKSESSYIIMCDLFRGIKRVTAMFFYIPSQKIALIGNYLLLTESHVANISKFRIFKINYDDLSLTYFKTIEIGVNFDYGFKVLCDQLDSQKFVIYDINNFVTGKIQNDQIIMDNVKKFPNTEHYSIRLFGIRLYGERLIGNKLQCFTGGNSTENVVKFCEADLDTIKNLEDVKKTEIPIILDGEPLDFFDSHSSPHYWSKNRFYKFYNVRCGICHCNQRLLMFDPETLKWTDVQVWAYNPVSMFIDKNEILTLQSGKMDLQFSNYNETYFDPVSAYYRIALRSPDKLMKLTAVAAARESVICGNTKYVKIVRQIPIGN